MCEEGKVCSIFVRTCCIDSWYICSSLLLFLISGRRVWSATSEATVHVLLFLFCRLQDLTRRWKVSISPLGVRYPKSDTYLERTQQAFVNTHHGACIVEFAAVIGCAKESDELSLREELVAVFHDLMRSANQIHVVLLQESRYNVGTKSERHAAIVFAPSCNVLVGIGPQEITEKAAVRNLKWSAGRGDAPPSCPRRQIYLKTTMNGRTTYISRSHDTPDLLHRVQVRAETTVHCEDLLVNNGCNWQAVEAVSEGLPQLDIVPSLALVVESIYAINGGTFVVAAEDEEIFRVFDLVRQQQADGLERLFASINIVA